MRTSGGVGAGGGLSGVVYVQTVEQRGAEVGQRRRHAVAKWIVSVEQFVTASQAKTERFCTT